MSGIRGFILLTICAIALFQCVSSKHHKRETEVKRATYNVTLDGADSTETTADILTRLKLLAYAEKLKAKQAKKKAKADKKAQKEAAFQSYLSSLAAASPAGSSPGSPGAAAPPAPLFPGAGIGLFKKSFILQQLAQAQAAAAAAAAATPSVADQPTTVNPYLADIGAAVDDNDESDE